jgi:hypothetical protein
LVPIDTATLTDLSSPEQVKKYITTEYETEKLLMPPPKTGLLTWLQKHL